METEDIELTSNEAINPEEQSGLESEQETKKDEKLLTQSEVNKLVGEAKIRGYKKAQRELMQQQEASEMAAQQQAVEAQATPAPVQPQAPQAQAMDESQIAEMVKARVAEEQAALQKAQQEAELKRQQEEYALEVNRIADQYYERMRQGAEKYPDFTEKTESFDPSEFKEVVLLIGDMDNTADLVYELNQNPQLLASVSYFAQTGKWNQAKRELEKLTASIQKNSEAKQNYKAANPPLDRLNPSPGAGADGSEMSIADFKRKYRV